MDQRDEESEWVSRCLAGDSQAFRPLVERYERMVRAVIRRLIDAEHEVNELAQMAFVTAYERLAQYSGAARFSTWLCEIALNKSRDALRSRRRQPAADDIDELDLESGAPGPDGQLEEKQRDVQLQAALRRLKPVDREVVVFKYILGSSYEEVARVLGCTPEAAKVRSHRAREELKRILESMGVTPVGRYGSVFC